VGGGDRETFWDCCHPATCSICGLHICVSALLVVYCSDCTYVCRAFWLLDDVLSLHFLPALTGQPAFGPIEWELLSLPACHGGLDVIVPTLHFSASFSSSSHIAALIIDHLLRQCIYQCKHDWAKGLLPHCFICSGRLTFGTFVSTFVLCLWSCLSAVHHVG